MYSSSINQTSSNSTNQRNIVEMFSGVKMKIPLVEARIKEKEEKKTIKERKKNNIEKVLEKIIKKYQSQCRLFKKQELPLTMGLLLKLTSAPYKLGINKLYNKLMAILNSYEENDLLIHLLPELSQFKKGSVSNPYKLVEINRSYTPIISYKMAEKIEAEYNLDIKLKDKLYAISSKIIYEGTTKSSYVLKEDFDKEIKKIIIKEGARYFEIEEEIENITIKVKDNRTKKIYTTIATLKFIEEIIETRLLGIKNGNNMGLEFDKSKMSEINRERMSEEQISAVKNIVEGNLCTLYGPPGAGKSEVIKECVRQFENSGVRVICTAISGQAARNLKGTGRAEIGTWMKMVRVTDNLFNSSAKRKQYEEIDMDIPEEDLVLIIDEASMVDMFQLQTTLWKLSRYPKKVKLILIGDKDQLPSINMGNIFSDILKSEVAINLALTKIFRQVEGAKGTKLLLDDIRKEGRVKVKSLKEIKNTSDVIICEWSGKRERIKEQEKQQVVELKKLLMSKKLDYKNHPEDTILLTPQNGNNEDKQDYHMGVKMLNKICQNIYNPAGMRIKNNYNKSLFRKGDRIVYNDNCYDRWKFDLLKGSDGKIIDYTPSMKTDKPENGEVEIMLDDEMETITIKVKELYEDWELGYARTIHKAQGATVKNVILCVNSNHSMWGAWSKLKKSCSGRRLLYVGCSRHKESLYVITEKYYGASMLVKASISDGERITGLFKDYMEEVVE
jgi:ATP-dependent exoDNAse (exonuclease V) alpha subunit